MNTIRKSLVPALTATATVAALLFVGASPASAAVAQSASPRLAGVTLTLDNSKIYPHLDGYRDSLRISVAKTVTGTTAAIRLTGKVTIKHGTKTEATYPIASSRTESFGWDGHVAGKLQPGSYTVTATVAGATAMITRHATVIVSAGQLVTRSKIVSVPAATFFSHGYSSTSSHNTCVAATGGAIACTSTRGGHVAGNGNAAVPPSVYKYAAYQPYLARVAVTISHTAIVAGSRIYWEWNGANRFGITSAGTHGTPSVAFGKTQKDQDVRFAVSGASKIHIDKVVITYKYAILS